MLIFTTDPYSSIKLEEQVAEAIKGGCRWIQLRLPANAAYEEKIAQAKTVLELCRPYDMILTIENETSIVEELKVHGIHLDESNTPSANEIRRRLGPHAIIGITTSSADTIKRLYDLADIDYTIIPQNTSSENAGTLVNEIAKMGLNIPVVISVKSVPDIEKCSATFRNGVRGLSFDSQISLNDSIEKIITSTLDTIDTALKN